MDDLVIEAPGHPDNFHHYLGIFHGLWLATDIIIDYAIGRFLKSPHEDTHILTAGLEFGRKIRILIDLAKRSTDPKKEILVEALRTMQGSKREIITHSYLKSDKDKIIFLNRSRGGPYKATETKFSREEFIDHVKTLVLAAQKFETHLDLNEDDFQKFAASALSLNQN
ncbi:MAG: hypothetical protein OJJ21_23905 [Ferrovibrio sp.]|uniref:hypothetical protein n=1 Tax=Ferrovibrio sp. TaxID=1917215 RepID=UPI00262DAC1E|nr:hypothetical protein [Ferrovibrio sp.]MCW0236663.1 hypothetical protein [Ferrovibrio sp.]